MDRNRITTECIEYQNIKILVGFYLENETRVTRYDFAHCFGLREKCKVVLGKFDDVRIDFIETVSISFGSIRG